MRSGYNPARRGGLLRQGWARARSAPSSLSLGTKRWLGKGRDHVAGDALPRERRADAPGSPRPRAECTVSVTILDLEPKRQPQRLRLLQRTMAVRLGFGGRQTGVAGGSWPSKQQKTKTRGGPGHLAKQGRGRVRRHGGWATQGFVERLCSLGLVGEAGPAERGRNNHQPNSAPMATAKPQRPRGTARRGALGQQHLPSSQNNVPCLHERRKRGRRSLRRRQCL